MNESAVLAGVLVGGVLVEAVRVVRPGQLLAVPHRFRRGTCRAAVGIFGTRTREVRVVTVPPAGPALLFGGAARPPALPGGPQAVQGIREQVRELERATAPLLWVGRFLFVHLVVFTPVALFTSLVPHRWWWTGATLAIIQATILTGFWLAHRRFHPAARGERVQHLINILVFPPAGVYAADFVVGDLFAGVHPLAGALAVLEPADAAARAGALWRQWEYPVPGDAPAPSFGEREALANALEAFGVAVVDICAPPPRDGPASRTYCPRCLAQFTVAGSDCPDCPGVARRAFA